MSNLYKSVEKGFSENNWRITRHLRNILTILEESDTLLSISKIQQILKIKKQKIDNSTIYRILNKLKKIKLIHEFENKWKSCSHPQNTSDEHHFLICNNCKNVEEIFLDYKDSIAEQLLQEKKFKLEHVHLGFFGYCKNCHQ